MSKPDKKVVLRNFRMPEAAAELVDFFLDEEEQRLIADFEERIITEKDYGKAFLAKEFHRGVISKADDAGNTWVLNDFYGFLDVFCVSRKEEYDRLTMTQKRSLDDWYFDAYYNRLDTSDGRPTPDRVLPLDEILKMVEADPRPLYLTDCDCRMLTGECGHSTRTCISWRDGVNSFPDRGLSERITKEKAYEIIRTADREGLIHTTMGMGLCNCCADCCYLLRAQRRLKSTGVWPASAYIAACDASKCIGCGKCIRRCQMDVFSMADTDGNSTGKISADFKKCIGCGLCVDPCPAGALRLVPR